MTRPILGIDPGVTGGLAFLSADSVEVYDIPSVAGEVDVDAVAALICSFSPAAAVIERASARPGQGVSSMFKFGAAYGALRAVVVTLAIPSYLVAPAVWKRFWKLDADKEKARALAIRMWPGNGGFSRKKDHGRAEAALIARYGSLEIEGCRAVLPAIVEAA